MESSYLELKNIYFKHSHAQENTLKGITFSLEHGKILGIQGASGSGKSTLLRVIAGLEFPQSGAISINKKIICDDTIFIEPENRNIGMVFQDYALFPHLTVEKNILFGVDDKHNAANILREMLELVNIHDLVKRYPHELSGGQQQRVAIARTLARKPSLLLLDEPFSSLDTALQSKIRTEIHTIVKKSNITTIFVSHNEEDICSISDHIMHLHEGVIKDLSASPYKTM